MPADATFNSRLQRLFRASRFAARLLAAEPGLAAWLAAEAARPFDLAASAAALLPHGDAAPDAFDAALRTLRRRTLAHLLFRDLNGLASLDEVLAAFTQLATVSLRAATARHVADLASRWGLGDAPDALRQPLVMGMGKLGGGELNASSDVDLIFVHAEDGEAGGGRSWHEFHCEVGKRLIRSLDAVDAGGFVFRVDMRLRPFGASGPLVSSLAALESYFVSHARTWERYAWLKAAALTGEASAIAELEALVTPFVYRRYHDYAAIDGIREIHAQIRAETAKKRARDDIKLGPGGIRELEFVVQMFQLIRGGRETALRVRSTRGALDVLPRLGLMPAERVARLHAAYAFLRNLEHRLQYLDDQQTQALPSNTEDQQRIAEAMNFATWSDCTAALDAHRAVVLEEFEALFSANAPARNEPVAPGGTHAQCEALLNGSVKDDARAAILQRVDSWLAASRTQSLAARPRARLEALIPKALAASLLESGPQGQAARTFSRVFDLLEAIDKREAYLALLEEVPAVLSRVTRIAAQSAFAAGFLKKHPVLLDDLIDTRERGVPIDWAAQRERLRAACDAAAGDVERQYEILRHTKHLLTLRLNVVDIDGGIGVMALSDELTALADLLLEATLVLAARALRLIPADAWDAPAGFAVIAYGKYGSKELGYASDLDLVFVCADAADPGVLSRLGQRVISWLNAMTAGGVLYDTDLRLRPDGDAGVMVSRLAAFADYQRTRAWTWEHQALTRARWCAGDATLRDPVERIRAEILSMPRDATALKQEIVAMREKMRADKKDGGARLDLKHTRGGIVDVEFIVQFLILAHSHDHPEFLGNLGNFALLTRAAALGFLDENLAASVGKAYLAYRERQHVARNNNEAKTWIAPEELAGERRAVERAWEALLG
ncbi:MAG: bifunctional [glutamate--ammonia ligase]-adenylyl-L-tyrosine phosphorylase/[glutamate--ammonia-ligase] adenylyltransferase [Betaproteobacteria bacterium]|nr:bifunctional [glutamate--ammonia ligase]-adenylyl-L-tyrosine phosphorylase/[glutamate--ammonia-ligase] adenylyltransferase [Betaproteobacteria bacterium]